MRSKYTLISHQLCPYVQRAAITLTEKGLDFDRVDIDLANKPDWFLQVSPLGKTPVLLVDGQVIFESAVICEYLDETTPHRLHPQAALERAQHRAWIEFASATLNSIGGFYNAPDKQALNTKVTELKTKFAQLEKHPGDGPYFSGENFSLVDAAFAPVFRYFEVFEQIADFGFFTDLPQIRAWRQALQARVSVQTAVSEDYPALLSAFLRARHSALSALMQ
ncbi:glutathione S-transferase family protein [Undibacterium sp. CY18W]|uniref:glutathione transferase n=1 Tax=Undibacterium hunanense TaxID=2762292 RepID=A0ABR6ZS77_9BURK|nr:glutathione S-transferase family protein [Undibacterium hunanense]MBC3918398.1 glutathione S-transferase family protein [Undibacterium hunanense]